MRDEFGGTKIPRTQKMPQASAPILPMPALALQIVPQTHAVSWKGLDYFQRPQDQPYSRTSAR